MHEVTLNMPLVKKCSATNCGYNTDQHCHAKAITVGDSDNPGCDTFFVSEIHGHRSQLAGVGACKVAHCAHNRDFECSADSIVVGKVDGMMKCLTCQKANSAA